MAQLDVILFGNPQIESANKPIQIERYQRKAIALLAYLAISGERHHRDQLGTLLWPDYDQTRARAAVSRVLWALRKAIGEASLSVDRDTIYLREEEKLRVDVNCFRRLLVEISSHDHLPSQLCPACLLSLEKAVKLYRDGFMSGFSLSDSATFDEWQCFQSEGLHHKMMSAVEKLVDEYIAQGRFEKAISYAQQWLSLDPLHEPAHQQLMRLYAWSNQRAAALKQYQACVQLLDLQLGLPVQAQTDHLYQEIATDCLAPPPSSLLVESVQVVIDNTLNHPDSFLGREKELAEIACRLRDPDCRLLTLVGPGGIGKTRLAFQVKATYKNRCHHDVYFVPLAHLNSMNLLPGTIAYKLGIPLQSDKEIGTQLINHLRQREILLILDNFEHLLEGVGLLVDILQHCPLVKILVTSRERLNLRWEWLISIEGLCVPECEEREDVETYSAVRLFVERARRVRRDFALRAENQVWIVRICRFLQGMPLGIELAAAWIPILSCREIAVEVERCLEFLTTAAQDIPHRHRNLQAVFDHSWYLLESEERALFCQTAVFQGGFQREAAEVVMGATPFSLLTLTNKSMLMRDASGRYKVLEVIRQYAEERSREYPVLMDEAREQHCQYYLQFLCQREKNLSYGISKQVVEEVKGEIENIRVAWLWAIANGRIHLMQKSLKCLVRFYEIQGWYQEGEEVLQMTVDKLWQRKQTPAIPDMEQNCLIASVLARQAWLCQQQAHFEQAKALAEQSLNILSACSTEEGMALPLTILGVIATQLGDYTEARLLSEKGRASYAMVNNQKGEAACLNNLGVIALRLKQYGEAQQLFQHSLTINRQIGYRAGEHRRLSNLGLVAASLQEFEQAKLLHEQAMMVGHEVGDFRRIGENLTNLGFVLFALGHSNEAETCFQKALAGTVETQMVSLSLKALTGLVTVLVEENKKEQALIVIHRVLQNPSVLLQIKERTDRFFAMLELQLHPLHRPAMFSMIKEQAAQHLMYQLV